MRGREPGDDAHVAEARGGEQFGGPGNLGPDPAPVELVGGYDYLASYVHSQQRAPLDALMNRLTAIDPEYRRGFGDAHVPAGRRLESGSGGRELGELGTKAGWVLEAAQSRCQTQLVCCLDKTGHGRLHGWW